MLKVFMDTHAAKQIKEYGEEEGWDDEQIQKCIESAYKNACDQDSKFDTLLFKNDVEGSLGNLSVDSCFVWYQTPEGQEFWLNIENP